MQLTSIEAWVRFLRRLYSVNPKGKTATLEVEVSSSYPFADIPENSNLANNPAFSSSPDGAARKPDRRYVNPPEVTVHNAGEVFDKKYMDNFVAIIYSHDVQLPEVFRDKIALIKNVFLEQENGALFVLQNKDHYIFDRDRHAISFHCEYFDLIPIGATVHYNLELYTGAIAGMTEVIDAGVVVSGEQIGILSSLEGNAITQIDFWGGDSKQAEWLLQRFRRAWIDERALRSSLAAFGIIAFNMNWSHGGMIKSLDTTLRPYLFNITATVKYNTEYKLIQLSQEFLNEFEAFSGGDWRGETIGTYEGRTIRRYTGTIAPNPLQYVVIEPQVTENEYAVIPKGSNISYQKS